MEQILTLSLIKIGRGPVEKSQGIMAFLTTVKEMRSMYCLPLAIKLSFIHVVIFPEKKRTVK